MWIHQNAWFHQGSFDQGHTEKYHLKDTANGVYAFVIIGDITINGQALTRRDGLGLWGTTSLDLKADSQGAEVLLMEVPMNL